MPALSRHRPSVGVADAGRLHVGIAQVTHAARGSGMKDDPSCVRPNVDFLKGSAATSLLVGD